MRSNEFLLELYRLTGSGPSAAFSAAAFELLNRLLPFHSGLWATFTLGSNGPDEHSLYLHNLSAQMIEEYERVKQYDVLNQQAVAHCGRTFNVTIDDVKDQVHPAMLAHARKWRLEHTLATMILETPVNLYTAFCLYRPAAQRPFSERERQRAEAAVPHLVQAWHLSELRFLAAPSPAPREVPRALALIDRFGIIHNAESGVAPLLRREAPEWQGPSVPAELLEALRQNASQFRGHAIVASVVRQLPDRRLLIAIRARAAVDTLTKRETTVAREFASGKTYKEIAKALKTSPTTVRTQIQTIYMKLGVGTKVDLARHVAHSE